MGLLSCLVRTCRTRNNLQFVRNAAADLDRAASPMPDEETALVAASTVFSASLQHMDKFWHAAEFDIVDGIRYLDGLRLAVGILTSARLRTLALTGARHLRKIEECYEIEYQPHEIKTKKPFDLMLPPELTRYIERGFRVSDRWRDHMLTEDKPLWINRNGQQMSHAQIYARTCATTLELLRVELSPQQIRRVGPSSLRKFAPRQAHLATSMLQHGTPRITVKSYMKTGTSAATVELHQLRLKRYGTPKV